MKMHNDCTAVLPTLVDPVDVKKGDELCEIVFLPSIQPDKMDQPMDSWPRPGPDIDDIGQNWEDCNTIAVSMRSGEEHQFDEVLMGPQKGNFREMKRLFGEASSGDPIAFSTLRQPRCIEWMALVSLMVTL